MITTDRDGKTVRININTGVNVSAPVFPFVRSFEDETTAEIVRLHIRHEIMQRMEKIRRVSYERGWSDAKKKRPKSDIFPSATLLFPWEKGR